MENSRHHFVNNYQNRRYKIGQLPAPISIVPDQGFVKRINPILTKETKPQNQWTNVSPDVFDGL